MHSKYPTALNLQARVMYLGGDADTAVALQLKALAYFEQLEGLDSAAVSADTDHNAFFFFFCGRVQKGSENAKLEGKVWFRAQIESFLPCVISLICAWFLG